MTKKDLGLVFHFHVLNLYKCWSKRGLTKIEMRVINSKKTKKCETCAHSTFMSYTKDLSRGLADSKLFHQISCTLWVTQNTLMNVCMK